MLLWLFALSGASGLTFEILWARQLATVVGATSSAITTVVALFMAGLAIGSARGGALAARLRRPAFAYGLTEIGIAVLALAVSQLLPRLEGLSSLPARYLAAALALLVPSGLMGLTFPLVVESLARRGRRVGGLAYALNTAGAALGCVAAGFVGVGWFGVRGTAAASAAVNLGCGLLACWLFRGATAGTRATGVAAQPARAEPGEPHDWSGLTVILLLTFTAGAAALSAEILWTRALIPYLNSSTYAFAAILSVFLLALAAGSGLVAQRFARASAETTARALLLVQLALALAVAATPRLMTAIELSFAGYVGVRRVMSLSAWLATVAGVFARTALVIGVPTLLMGASFPLCLRLGQTRARAASGGATAGWISAASTLGGIAGSVGAGFGLLPKIGVLAGLRATALVHLATAGIAAVVLSSLWSQGTRAAQRRRLVLLLALALAGVVLLGPGRGAPFVGRLAEGHHLVLVDEGPQDTTAVVDIGPTPSSRQRLIFSNGISYTGDNPPSRRYMRLLGHLPVLLADDPGASLVICIGTGMTAAAVARHPAVSSLDLVDISPVVRGDVAAVRARQ